jgi:hypothetical protein
MGRRFKPPARTKANTRVFNVHLPERLYLFVMNEAIRRGTSLAQVMRDLIADRIAATEKDMNPVD